MSLSLPVIVVPKNGEEALRGTLTSRLEGGTFGVANNKIQCAGTYPNEPGEKTVTVTAKCSDGRTATGTAVKTAARAGSGTMKMSDGTEALFAYGDAAYETAPHPAVPALPPTGSPRGAQQVPSTTPQAPPAAPVFRAEIAKSESQFGQCIARGVGYLDDAISSVDAVADAVLSACRPEAEALCKAGALESGLSNLCTYSEVTGHIHAARPAVAARVLAWRAAQRLRKLPQQPTARPFDYRSS
jgi:hypothetical protein